MTTLLALLEITGVAIARTGAAFAAGIIVLAASYGIAKIGAAALESIARQPEAAGDIRGSMVVAAALIEGVSFFAIIICTLVILL
ncbi:MAG: ATP synthase F0 subunit C [Tenuifilaceae bacterium]|jgi:F-type H+-transporting ATPase subunit c|nr:ATP synthase F0 subunit C [Bacteroidales bacterium]MDI9516314.1 ATP synthase F0 subunit C [Bacteroidota bacterium]NLH55551.1 ATP synthase F0 subunit C [Rikenellaceae bacterium]OQC61590.1 MAG: ATP synthase subunit c [Bacteroidetes bacterium ADurb.Bin008]HNS29743.1 ATP synthase F0 subunit C [Tenuifilaceae bacterium]